MGSLNAAYASQTGLNTAAPNSVVGQISAYSDAISQEDRDIAIAAASLAAMANKSVDQAVVDAVSSLFGLDDAINDTEAAVADAVAATQAAEAE
jgi:hypothetical protein